MNRYLIFSIIAGIFFAVWPNLAGKAKMSSYGLMILVGLCSVIVGVIMKIIQKESLIPSGVNTSYLIILLPAIIGAFINAFGYIFYSPVIKISYEEQTTFYIVATTVAMILTTYFYEVFFYHKPIELQRIIGVCLLIFGIYLLKK